MCECRELCVCFWRVWAWIFLREWRLAVDMWRDKIKTLVQTIGITGQTSDLRVEAVDQIAYMLAPKAPHLEGHGFEPQGQSPSPKYHPPRWPKKKKGLKLWVYKIVSKTPKDTRQLPFAIIFFLMCTTTFCYIRKKVMACEYVLCWILY